MLQIVAVGLKSAHGPHRRPMGQAQTVLSLAAASVPLAVLNGILWVLRTGAPWHDLPERYPSYQTCHRRFQQW